jgi:hypothetical protein
MTNTEDDGATAPLGVRLRRMLFRLAFGVEIEWGDSVFYTLLSLVLICLLWLMTLEKWFGVSVWFCLVPWAALTAWLWRCYRRRKGEG